MINFSFSEDKITAIDGVNDKVEITYCQRSSRGHRQTCQCWQYILARFLTYASRVPLWIRDCKSFFDLKLGFPSWGKGPFS